MISANVLNLRCLALTAVFLTDFQGDSVSQIKKDRQKPILLSPTARLTIITESVFYSEEFFRISPRLPLFVRRTSTAVNTNLATRTSVFPTTGYQNPKYRPMYSEPSVRLLRKGFYPFPYYPDDVLSSIAIKDLFNVPLCTYIMDDQNVSSNSIPDELLKELLEKSDLRFAISPELCDAYEKKFKVKFWFVPPVVEKEFVRCQSEVSAENQHHGAKRGIMIGNIWSQRWLDRLRNHCKRLRRHNRVVRESQS